MSPLEERALLVKYLLNCVRKKDWHGVMDASADLREIEAAHPELKSLPIEAA